MTTYSELLRDPRWQKKRLEILERDEFLCQECHDSVSTLHVHHCFYEKGTMPWDYPASSLLTLCEHCHAFESQVALGEKKLLSRALGEKGFLAADYNSLACAFDAMEMRHFKDDWVAAFSWAIETRETQDLIVRAYFRHLKRRQSAFQSRTESNG